jgi:hypothetical protein
MQNYITAHFAESVQIKSEWKVGNAMGVVKKKNDGISTFERIYHNENCGGLNSVEFISKNYYNNGKTYFSRNRRIENM